MWILGLCWFLQWRNSCEPELGLAFAVIFFSSLCSFLLLICCTDILSCWNMCPECREWCSVVLFLFRAGPCTSSILCCNCLVFQSPHGHAIFNWTSCTQFLRSNTSTSWFSVFEFEAADLKICVKLENSKEIIPWNSICVVCCFGFFFSPPGINWYFWHQYESLISAVYVIHGKYFGRRKNGQKRSHYKEGGILMQFKTLFPSVLTRNSK